MVLNDAQKEYPPVLANARMGIIFRFEANKSFRMFFEGGALVSTGIVEALVAGRGAAGLVKSGN